MPVYKFYCEHCKNSHEVRVDVDRRDDLQVCPYCGNGAQRQFLISDVIVPWTFNAAMISDVEPTREQIQAQERRNEEYLANKPKENPTFERCVIEELDKRGIRHPNRLIEP